MGCMNGLGGGYWVGGGGGDNNTPTTPQQHPNNTPKTPQHPNNNTPTPLVTFLSHPPHGLECIYGLYEWGGGGYWVREDGVTTTPQQHPKNTPTPQQHPKNTPTPPLSFPIHPSGPERIYGLYERVGTNCFVAAGLYLLLGGFALCQARLNKRKEYLVR